MKSTLKFVLGPIALVGLFGLWGIRWGLPSMERTNLFLPRELRTPDFYSKVAQARQDLYSKMGDNPLSYMGRLVKMGQPNTLPTLFNSYSSFLLKPHSTDEGGTLAYLANINPLKNRWYPHVFAYGGAYLFPLGGYLAFAHGLHLIHLVSSPTFYYLHPPEIARIYLAARVWSIVGIFVATLAVFSIGNRFLGPVPAVWAMLFFGLAPTCIAHTKFAKPHTWAAGLTLWAIDFAIRAKEDTSRTRLLVGASVLLGLAVGMTITQVAFLPFLLWAVWSEDWSQTWRRGLTVFAVVGSVYLATNFYLLAHINDYLEERFFLSRFAPFRFNASALYKFYLIILRLSLGWELWVLALLGWGWASFQTRHKSLRTMAWWLSCITVYVAFQTQSTPGLPPTSRLFLAMIGILCVFAAGITFRWGTFGRVCRWICLVALLVKGGLYDLHFASDRAPVDNASLAALWVQKNVPVKSWVAQTAVVPHVDFFPPVDFSKYTITQIDGEALALHQGPAYAIISGKELEAKANLLQKRFQLLQRFNESPLQKLGFDDPFTNANFPVEIYGRDIPSSSGLP